MSENNESKRFRLWHAFAAAAVLLIISFFTLTAIRAVSFKKTTNARKLSAQESISLGNLLVNQYPEKYKYLKSLPYNIAQPQ